MNKQRFSIFMVGLAAVCMALAGILVKPSSMAYANDPYAVDDAYTVVLLHMNGDDASTTFTDENGRAWAASGNAQLDTDQKKFGSASGLFDNNGDYISTNDSNDFYFDGDFTIDFWARWNSLPTTGTYDALYSQYPDGVNYCYLYLMNSSGSYNINFTCYASSAVVVNFSHNITVETGQWYHLALVKTGNDYKTFKNGTLLNTTTDSDALPNVAASLVIGKIATTGYFDGWLDEYRVSKGIARWTSNFTPPGAEYEPTPTPTATNTSTPTNTATNTPTDTPTETLTPSVTPSITLTPSNTPTETSTPTETFTPTLTFTPSMTFTPSLTYTPGGPTITPNGTEWTERYLLNAEENGPTVQMLSILCMIIIFVVMAGFVIWLVNRRST